MKVYRVNSSGWATVDRSALPAGMNNIQPSLVLGTKDSARAGVFHVGSEYVVLATLVGNDTTALLVGNYQHLLRVLSDLSAVIGCDLATRMHTDLQAQIEEANAQVMEVVQEHTERKSHEGHEASQSGQGADAPKFLRRTQD